MDDATLGVGQVLARLQRRAVVRDLNSLQGGIDAMLGVTFAGNTPLKTKHPNKKGPAPIAVAWNEQLWLPVTVPTATSTITCLVEDWDRLGENDKVPCSGPLLARWREQRTGDCRSVFSTYLGRRLWRRRWDRRG